MTLRDQILVILHELVHDERSGGDLLLDKRVDAIIAAFEDMDQLGAMRATLELARSRTATITSQAMPDSCSMPHFEHMLQLVEAGYFPVNKLGRFLGWMQGALAAQWLVTLDEMKELNKRFKR